MQFQRLLDCLDHYTRGQSQTGHFSARALHYNALELKGLVQEVRETSDEKSGLQEFYETLERIVNELKGMTEHSIAFLQRVRKSDAPNYFDSKRTSGIHRARGSLQAGRRPN